jgi:hypothetical protein
MHPITKSLLGFAKFAIKCWAYTVLSRPLMVGFLRWSSPYELLDCLEANHRWCINVNTLFISILCYISQTKVSNVRAEANEEASTLVSRAEKVVEEFCTHNLKLSKKYHVQCLEQAQQFLGLQKEERESFITVLTTLKDRLDPSTAEWTQTWIEYLQVVNELTAMEIIHKEKLHRKVEKAETLEELLEVYTEGVKESGTADENAETMDEADGMLTVSN